MARTFMRRTISSGAQSRGTDAGVEIRRAGSPAGRRLRRRRSVVPRARKGVMVSLAGEAVTTLPTTVARFRSWGDAISRQAWARGRACSTTSREVATLPWVTVAPISRCRWLTGRPAGRSSNSISSRPATLVRSISVSTSGRWPRPISSSRSVPPAMTFARPSLLGQDRERLLDRPGGEVPLDPQPVGLDRVQLHSSPAAVVDEPPAAGVLLHYRRRFGPGDVLNHFDSPRSVAGSIQSGGLSPSSNPMRRASSSRAPQTSRRTPDQGIGPEAHRTRLGRGDQFGRTDAEIERLQDPAGNGDGQHLGVGQRGVGRHDQVDTGGEDLTGLRCRKRRLRKAPRSRG